MSTDQFESDVGEQLPAADEWGFESPFAAGAAGFLPGPVPESGVDLEGFAPQVFAEDSRENMGADLAEEPEQHSGQDLAGDVEGERPPGRSAEVFPSGEVLTPVPGPTGEGQEHWDPHGTGLPLLDTRPAVRRRKLSPNFTVGELVTSGGTAADRARISPALVRVLQAIRDRAGRPVRITSGYRSWARNQALYRARGQRPTKSRHCSGQAADITIAGLTGTQIAQIAVEVGGRGLGLGVGTNYAHVDVRGTWALWTYLTGAADAEARRAVLAHRDRRRPSPAPPAPVRPSSTAGGRLEVARVPMLARHRGSAPDLVLRWNVMSSPAAIDVVVHLHGYSGPATAMRLPRDKERLSGLDFTDPEGRDGGGRSRPTLALLPRGSSEPSARRPDRFVFPALTGPGAVDQLVREGLARFARHTGISAPLGRLILTAHSGGGTALVAVLRHTDPDEIHVFDAFYGPAQPVADWARRRIERERSSPSPVPPALRVLYLPGKYGTQQHSEPVGQAVCGTLARAGTAHLAPRFRVEATTVGHNDIPRRFGWRLLADAGADLPGVRRRLCGAAGGEAEMVEDHDTGEAVVTGPSAGEHHPGHADEGDRDEDVTGEGYVGEDVFGEDHTGEDFGAQDYVADAGEDFGTQDYAADADEDFGADAYAMDAYAPDAYAMDGYAPDTYDTDAYATDTYTLDTGEDLGTEEDSGQADEALAAESGVLETHLPVHRPPAEIGDWESAGFALEELEENLTEPEGEAWWPFGTREAPDAEEADGYGTPPGEVDSYGESDQLDAAGEPREDEEPEEFEGPEPEEFFGTLFRSLRFPSGAVLIPVTGATGKGQEHWDPHGTGLPLLDTGPAVRPRKLSANFTVGELASSGGVPSDKARISPQLVRLLQAIRDRAGKPVRVNSGYRSWARNEAVYRARKKKPTLSRHCSGQAADIRIAGLTGVQIAQLAIDAGGIELGIGVGSNYAHVDVRGRWSLWTYLSGSEDVRARRTVTAHRDLRRAGPAPAPGPAPVPLPAPSGGVLTRTPDRLAGRVVRPKVGPCTGSATAGARALAEQWKRLTGRRAGTYNCRSVRGRPSVPSVHGEGRAIDIYANAHDPAQRAQTDAYVAWLITHAVELQVVYIIWNRKQWGWPRRQHGWRSYSGVSPHTDHAHVELSWEGARHPSPLFAGDVPGIGGAGEASVPGPAPATGVKLSPAQFIARFGPHARASEAGTGVPAVVTLAQAAIESGWGEKAVGFNFFGIKARATDPPATRQLWRTTEVLGTPDAKGFPEIISVTRRPDGRYTYVVRDWFRVYPDVAAAFTAHGRLLRDLPRYAAAFRHTADPYAFAAEVAKAGYSTDRTGYARLLPAVMRTLERAGWAG